jgi:hypothetical protein
MDDNDLHAVVAALLPVLLGLGLIELYISGGASFMVVGTGLLGLGLLMVVIGALAEGAAMRRPRRRRSRSSRGDQSARSRLTSL